MGRRSQCWKVIMINFLDVICYSESIKFRLVVIAATNRIEDIDEAVIRRFESKVYVGVPNKPNRKLLIINFLKNIDYCLSDADLNHIADITFGWSASDLEVRNCGLHGCIIVIMFCDHRLSQGRQVIWIILLYLLTISSAK